MEEQDSLSQSRWRPIRVRFEVVESAYGSGNYDDAGDDMVYALRQVSEWPEQYRYRFATDTTHPNPWYHTLSFEVEGVPDPVFARLVGLIKELGLVPERTD